MPSFLLASRFYVSWLLLHFLKRLGELRLRSTFRAIILLLICRFWIVSLENSLDGCIVIIDGFQAILHLLHSPVPQRFLVFLGHLNTLELRLFQLLYRILKFAGLCLAIGTHLNLLWLIHCFPPQSLNKLWLCNLMTIVLRFLSMFLSLFIIRVRDSCRLGRFINITTLFRFRFLLRSAIIRVNGWLFEYFLFFLWLGFLTWLILCNLQLAKLWFILECSCLTSCYLLHLRNLIG